MKRYWAMGAVALLVLAGCNATQHDALEVADVNARNALDQAASAKSQISELESRVSELETAVQTLQNDAA